MSGSIKVISSMATRLLLEDLSSRYQQKTGVTVQLESVGGVDAAQRVLDGEVVDIAILAAGAIQKLIDAERVIASSAVALVRSRVAVAVPAGHRHPDISSESALRNTVLSAPSLSFSTGPSGVALADLFKTWGISEQLANRIQVPPPGVPVGSLLASGKVSLGFQQYSELMHVEGIDVLGPLPDPVRIESIFTGGICASSEAPDLAAGLLAFFHSDEADACKRHHGMEPA